jgi:hypothetical protein
MLSIFWPKSDEVTGNGENYVERSLMICSLAQYCSGDNIEKNEMGAACSAYGREERTIHGFGVETCGKVTTWKTRA